jgi:hypothetical protein
MKTGLISLFVCIMGISAAYSQAIPPYGGGQTAMPDSIPKVADKKTDLPCKAGSYVIEGGGYYYRTSGEYYKQAVDSNGNTYDPWGVVVNPSAEFFLFDMFALGGTANFEYTKKGADKELILGLGPIISVYYNKSYPIIPFFSIFGMYEHTNLYQSSTSSMYWTDQSLVGGVKAGFVYMISRQGGIFIDGRFTYGKHQVSTPPVTSQSDAKGWVAEAYFGFKFFVF